MRQAMSPTTHDYVGKLWELIDDVLNAILFLLIGLEMLVIPFSWFVFCLGLVAILIVLLSRYISVAIPIALLKYRIRLEKNAAIVLTWGGLRGGISVALALSLPAGEYNNIFIAVTYMIVLFSIVVQGLTIGGLVKRTRQ
jgi:CPA1 family monovalent cation:H+ antiporter